MADVLSQSEVESLLAALDPAASGASPAPRSSPPAVTARKQSGQQVSVYDFKRPERVSKEQMRAFQSLHESLGREFGAALSAMLRAIVEVKLISVDQLTYSEFVFSLENPTCFNLLESKGLEGNLILDFSPSIIFPIVDRLLGGGKEAVPAIPNRPLTAIELRLVSRITKLVMTGLEKSWANICQLQLRVVQVESNPQLVQIVPPNEVIVLVSFEITMGDLRGIMNLCIPFNTIEPLAGKLSADSWSAYQKKATDPRQKAILEAGLAQATVGMVVNLAHTRLSAGEVANLSVGDVILTETDHKTALEVIVDGSRLFLAKAGSLKGKKAIQVTGQAEQPRELLQQRLQSLGLDSQPTATNASPPRRTG